MKRIYQSVIEEHFESYSQMAFMPGPRQAGKTTLAKKVCAELTSESIYLNWDYPKDRERILQGSDQIINEIQKDELGSHQPVTVAFDEIHKFSQWKNYLKGYYDYSKELAHTLVTGSAKLDIFKKGGDSLMGRYFLYHIHPFSAGELLQRPFEAKEFAEPAMLDDAMWQGLYEFGGFPDPLLKQDKRFLTRWQQLRLQQLFQEDIGDISGVSSLHQMEVLVNILQNQATGQLNYHALAKLIQVSDKTVKQWVSILNSLYYCFTIQPWHRNISRSLIKEPKLYLWDWSVIEDPGARIENLLASHLHKAAHFWTDIGLGKYQLHYLRDKDKKEVDFLVSKNNAPWMLVECKSSGNEPISANLRYFQQQTNAPFAFQVVYDKAYVDESCFSIKGRPVIVPARTFLSQLP